MQTLASQVSSYCNICWCNGQLPFFRSQALLWKSGPCYGHRKLVRLAHAFLVEPPEPSTAKVTVKKTTNITTLAVSPWRVPIPRSQYQWMPTLGGSPAKAGSGAAAAAAAAATAVGTCTLLEMKAGTQAQMASRPSRAALSSCDPLRAIYCLSLMMPGALVVLWARIACKCMQM